MLVGLMLVMPASVSDHGGMPGVVFAASDVPTVQNNPPAQVPPINVEINRGGRAWYASPVWVAIGVIALVVVVMLIAMAARGGGGGGGTTVVRG
ncbi:MAG TPA: hypothetical protein VFV78_06130 [Vicinamibacterales bacterium]|nr:hypothetical protein [Vicinamibacterales bacterium]